MSNDIILTPMQIQDLKNELVQTKEDLEKAQDEMKSYRAVEEDKTGWDDYTVLDNSYYQKLSSLVTKIDEIDSMLANYVLAHPSGNTVQVGSVVELADRDLKFMVVQSKVTSRPTMMEVSTESPIFGAIYMHKVGDICEYNVNGKPCKCVIGKIDNDYSNEMAMELAEDSLEKKGNVK